jgi:site-specific recombinase
MTKKRYPFWARARHHLNHSNMGYWYHCWHSIYNGSRLLWLFCTSIIHAFFPWAYKFHAAHGVMRIYEELKRMPHLQEAQERIAQEVKEEELKRQEEKL